MIIFIHRSAKLLVTETGQYIVSSTFRCYFKQRSESYNDTNAQEGNIMLEKHYVRGGVTNYSSIISVKAS